MASFQTLTEINDLIKKLEILKADKENLRSSLKNAKLESAQSLWKYEQKIRLQNSQNQKSIAHQQGLLLFAESEEELEVKLKKNYGPQIEKILPNILQVLVDKIIKKNEKILQKRLVKKTEDKNSAKIEKENLRNKQNQPQSLENQNCAIICSLDLFYLLGEFGKIATKIPKNTLSFLQFSFENKIYYVQPTVLTQNILSRIISQNLSKIAKIKLIETSENQELQENSKPEKDVNQIENLEEVNLENLHTNLIEKN